MVATNDDILNELKKITALLSGMYNSSDDAVVLIENAQDTETALLQLNNNILGG